MSCVDCLKNVVRGAKGLLKAAVGAGAAPDRVVALRRDECRNCPESTKDPKRANNPSKGMTVASRCNKCGCFLLPKTTLASASCPMGKW
jgi:hypothetical protein